jgi:MFS family permease
MLYFSAMSEEFVGPTAQRNFRLGVLNGLLFTLAETLVDPTLVLVAFVGSLTHSPLWLGLVVPLRDGAWFLPQLWVSGFLQSRPRKITLYRWMVVVRMATWLLMTAAVFLIRHPGWLLAVFFVTYGVYALAAGVGGLPFLEVVSKTIPPRRRGQFFAWRLALGGLAAIGASVLVRYLLDDSGPLVFPHNFGLLFALGWIPALIGLAAFALIAEPPDRAETVRPRASALAQLTRARQIIRSDGNYRYFLFLRMALLWGGAAIPFFAVYVQQHLGGPLSMVGVYLAVFTGSSLAANVLLGVFSARLGNRRTMVIASQASLIMTGVVLALMFLAEPLRVSGAVASLWLLPVFVLYGVRESAQSVSGQSLLLDIAPPSERTLYIGFTNSLLGLALLSTGLSGLVVARFGFVALTILAFGANLLGIAFAHRMRDVAQAGLSELNPAHTVPKTQAAP